jgi:hypothetical protein
MFCAFTGPRSTQEKVWQLCFAVAKATTQPPSRGGGRELHVQPYARRGQRIRGAWQRTWDETSTHDDAARRALGIGDDGEIRRLWFQAGRSITTQHLADSMFSTGPAQRHDAISGVLFESDLLWSVPAVVRLVGSQAS